MKKNILIVVLFLLVVLEGYFLLNSTFVIEDKKDEVVAVVKSDQTPDFSYCTSGHCPIFYSMDITKEEGQNHTIIRQPTHMTKGAGQIWVSNERQGVLFKSEIYANVGIEESPEKDGFYITYTTGKNYDVPKADRVKFINGTFEVTEDVEYEIKNDYYQKK